MCYNGLRFIINVYFEYYIYNLAFLDATESLGCMRLARAGLRTGEVCPRACVCHLWYRQSGLPISVREPDLHALPAGWCEGGGATRVGGGALRWVWALRDQARTALRGRENIPKDPTAGSAHRICLQIRTTRSTRRWKKEIPSGYSVARRTAEKISDYPRHGFRVCIDPRRALCQTRRERTPPTERQESFGSSLNRPAPNRDAESGT